MQGHKGTSYGLVSESARRSAGWYLVDVITARLLLRARKRGLRGHRAGGTVQITLCGRESSRMRAASEISLAAYFVWFGWFVNTLTIFTVLPST